MEEGVYCEEQRSAREDKRNWLDRRTAAAEKAAENGRSKKVHSITKSITGERRKQEMGVKDKHGVLRTETKERMQRWVDTFSEILNRYDPTNPLEEDEVVESEEIEKIDLGRWRLQEVRHALKMTKRGKETAVHEVCPELLRADINRRQCK